MTSRNLGLINRRGHRGVFFTGAGVLCAAAVTLSGCTGWTKKDESVTGTSRTERLEAQQSELEKSERARKAAVRKLGAARTASKARDSQLRAANKQIADLKTRLAKAGVQQVQSQGPSGAEPQSEQLAESLKAKEKELHAAKEAARKYRAELQAADKDVADLETRLAKAMEPPAGKAETQSKLKKSEQMVESLKARLEKTSKERDDLKTQLAEAHKEIAQTVEKMLAAAAVEEKEKKRQIGLMGAKLESVESEKNDLKQSCERVQQQMAQLDQKLKDAHAERDKLNNQLQASLAKVDAAEKDRTKVKQAAAKETKALRDELAAAKKQISNAEAKAASASSSSSATVECSSR